jgi:hypothetical protein
VIFHRGADNAAGVGDEIRQHQRARLVQHAFGFRGEGNVCALRDELGFQARHVISADDIRAGGGNPDFTFDIDHASTSSLWPSG